MKLKQILKQLDELSLINVCCKYKDAGELDTAFTGCAMDTPWYLAEYELYKGFEGDKSMFVCNKEDSKLAYLYICVKEN